MEPTSLIDDAEFSLPPEFFTDDDLLVEKENKSNRFSNRLFPHESSHGFESDSNFRSTVKPIGDEEKLCSHAFPAGNNGTKAWGSTRCVAVQNCHLMNINGYNNHNGRGLLDLPKKHPLAAARVTSYYNRQSLHYQKLQAIQLKQQQLMKYHRQLVQQSRGSGGANNNNDETAGSVDLSLSAWSNQPQRRDVFLVNRTGKRGSTGTGVFLPRSVNHATAEVREKPVLATVLVPARVVQSSPSLNDGSWSNDGGFSSQGKMEQAVKEPRLPLDWAY